MKEGNHANGHENFRERIYAKVSRRVLGVDPAAAGPTGYGIIESDGRSCRTVHYGTLCLGATVRNACAGAALEAVYKKICELIEEWAPDVVAVESVFTALNMKTALRLAEVRGVVLLAAAQHKIEVHSYAPREVKAAVAGYGQADKRQMQLMVRAILSMEETPEPADAADALAVALCHMQAEETQRRFGIPSTTPPTKLPPVSRQVSATRAASPRISTTR
jgi:crossover junction endodeoxyribonuclease RuvC